MWQVRGMSCQRGCGRMSKDGVLLYVGGDAQNVQKRRLNLTGFRCFFGRIRAEVAIHTRGG